MPVSFEEVARVVVDPHHRKRVVQLAIVMALVEGTQSIEGERAVQGLATALALDEEGLTVLYELTHGRALLARFDSFRRVGRFVRSRPGFPGVARMALSILGGPPTTGSRIRADRHISGHQVRVGYAVDVRLS